MIYQLLTDFSGTTNKSGTTPNIIVIQICGFLFIVVILLVSYLIKKKGGMSGSTSDAGIKALNNVKNQVVGDNQYGSSKFLSDEDMDIIYNPIPFEPELWRKGINLPEKHGFILGCKNADPIKHLKEMKSNMTESKDYNSPDTDTLEAYIDTGEVNGIMVGIPGIGKTARFFYPNIEFAFATGISFFVTDTKGDLYRNTAEIGEQYYGYKTKIIDLRNPSISSNYNLIYLTNKYMDEYKYYRSVYEESGDQQALAKSERSLSKAEKYAKITSKTIISSGDSNEHGSNQYFYDSAENIVTAIILALSEYGEPNTRHIVSVLYLLQDLMEPSSNPEKNQLSLLFELLPDDNRAKRFAASTIIAEKEAINSIISTALTKLLSFLDTELEQILCFDDTVDTEEIAYNKTAIYLVIPEEDTTKHFLATIFIDQLYRELLVIADENRGKLPHKFVFFCDEFGTMPALSNVDVMLSAGRSRGIFLFLSVQSLVQLDDKYGEKKADGILDCCHLTLCSGFSSNSTTAKRISESIGTYTTATASVSEDGSKTYSMTKRELMTSDELKKLPTGHFVLMKTGYDTAKVRLKLFFNWGIRFEEPFEPEHNYLRNVLIQDKMKFLEHILDAQGIE